MLYKIYLLILRNIGLRGGSIRNLKIINFVDTNVHSLVAPCLKSHDIAFQVRHATSSDALDH